MMSNHGKNINILFASPGIYYSCRIIFIYFDIDVHKEKQFNGIAPVYNQNNYV